jgi:hypothetical protein
MKVSHLPAVCKYTITITQNPQPLERGELIRILRFTPDPWKGES